MHCGTAPERAESALLGGSPGILEKIAYGRAAAAAGLALSRRPPTLRWAVLEAAQNSRIGRSPDHDYLGESEERLGSERACLAVARKLLKRSFHTLRELGEEAIRPA